MVAAQKAKATAADGNARNTDYSGHHNSCGCASGRRRMHSPQLELRRREALGKQVDLTVRDYNEAVYKGRDLYSKYS
jgi:hypothetical protein